MSSNLRDRARGQVIATRATAEPTGEGSIAAKLKQMEPELARVLPATISPARMARIALTVLRGNDELMEAANENPASFFGSLLTCAQLGLEPGPLNEAALIPYKGVVTFQPMYKGLLKLAWNSGAMASFSAQVVREHDDFDYHLGLHPDLTHRPASADRGAITYVYAVAVFKDGAAVFEVMSTDEVNEHRRRYSKQPNGKAWRDSWDGMALKTVVLRLTKWLPRSTESLELLHRAAALDNSVRTDIAPLAVARVQYAEIEEGRVDVNTGELTGPPAAAAIVTAAPVQGAQRANVRQPGPGYDPIGEGRLGTMLGLFKQVDLDGEGSRNYITGIIGRRIDEPDDLTGAEADQVITALQTELANSTPPGGQDALPVGAG